MSTIIMIIIILPIFYLISSAIGQSVNTKEYKDLVNKDKKIELNDFWKEQLETSTVTEKIIREGINKKLFYGKIKIFEKDISTLGTFAKPNYEDELIGKFKPSKNLLIYVEETLKFTDKLAKEKNIDKYGFVDLKTNIDSQNLAGTYLYKFTEEDELLLLKAPFNFLFEYSHRYPCFNAELINEIYTIPIEEIDYIHCDKGYEAFFSEEYLCLHYKKLRNINETSLS